MFIRLFPLVLAILIAGCDMSEKSHEQEGVQRQLIQGMHAEFFKVTDGKTSWFEVSISVDSSKTFRMPVFFSQNGKLVKVTDSQAQSIFDSWLKERLDQLRQEQADIVIERSRISIDDVDTVRRVIANYGAQVRAQI